MTYYDIIDSQVGQLLLISDGKILTGLYFMVYKKRPQILGTWQHDPTVFTQVIMELTEYLAGNRREFNTPFQLNGTDFQKKVWSELLRIPYGKTISYKDIAIAIDKPAAVRAVGTAVGRNPICIIGPCHRVLATGGGIGGYAGGLAAKQTLLALEASQA